MARFIERPVAIEAITFDELVEYGKANGGNMVSGMPWSFSYNGHTVTHENDDCYILASSAASVRFTLSDMLVSPTVGQLIVLSKAVFEENYQPAVTADPSRKEAHPLTCHVEEDRIAVYIGFDELAFAAANHPDFWDGESGEDVPNIKITDVSVFAREVVQQLNREDEDGSTLVTKLLDRAIEDAVGGGCEGVDHD